jgi:putative transposase
MVGRWHGSLGFISVGASHVLLRGNGGQGIFSGDEDDAYLYGLFDEGTQRFGYRIHAFCCISTHLHLAVQVGEIPLSRALPNVAFRYTRWINRRTQRVGHLFQGRYQAIPVDRAAISWSGCPTSI